jgi:hypothetical protein
MKEATHKIVHNLLLYYIELEIQILVSIVLVVTGGWE